MTSVSDTSAFGTNLGTPLDNLAAIAQRVVAGLGIGGAVDPDGALVARCKRGDTVAFSKLVERHERRVVGLVARIVSNVSSHGHAGAADVDDIAQEVFVLAWRGLATFRGDAAFSTWLYRIATNRALKEWRRAQRRFAGGMRDAELDEERDIVADDYSGPAVAANPELLIQQGARDSEIRAAIDGLPEKQRTVILLHYYEDYSCEEVAEMLGCSVGTVWSRLHYACRKLRESLSPIAEGTG